VLLATASLDIDEYIKQNALHYEVVGEIPYRKPLLQTVENLKPDVLILSLLLPGDEDLREIVFEAQRIANCRIILLTGSGVNRETLTTEMFFLGVRDFIPDPVQPKKMLEAILTPATYSEATQYMKKVPSPKDTGILTNMMSRLVSKNAPPPAAEISEQSLILINGILGLLGKTPAKTLEENLLLIEQGVGEIILRKARE